MRYGSASAGLLVDGYSLLSAKVKSVLLRIAALNEDSTGLGDTTLNKTPTGTSEITIEQGVGFFDTSTNGAHAALKDPATSAQGTPRVLCAWFAGQTVGAPFYGLSGVFQMVYDVISQGAQLTKANASYQSSGLLEHGQIVQPLATKTEDWNTKTLGTVVDYTTDPTNIAVPIVSNSEAAASVVTTSAPHGLTTGQVALIAGVTGSSPDINGEQVVTVLSATTFSVPVDTSAGDAGSGGTVKAANTVAGGAGYQHVTALSGITGFVGKLRDSADDVTYADLITFANVTGAPDVERAEVAGTIERYVSYDGNVTGTGSITAFAGLCRN